MGADAIPVGVVTGFWAVVGIVFPFIVPKGPNRGVTQVVLALTASTCWLFWLLCYMHQMNPLFGPQLHNTTVLAIQYLWDGSLTLDNLTTENPSSVSSTSATDDSFSTTETAF
ncbi:V-type proton ATPase subunit e 2-like [Panulirus ornatus]|uniref:V-type proton ATPase subunit e 2-like n=1 Tax=Panulirus ornatus TaxID=150431 RepID=UPI003A89229C